MHSNETHEQSVVQSFVSEQHFFPFDWSQPDGISVPKNGYKNSHFSVRLLISNKN